MKKVTLKINFENEKAMQHFISWLDGQGEQDYWLWQECREQDDSNEKITAIRFEYKKDEIDTVCGRLDKK